MAKTSATTPRIDHFFSAVAARLDRWRDLNRAAQTWAASLSGGDTAGLQAACAEALAELLPMEDFQAYPGARLLNAIKDRLAGGDALGTARLVQRVSSALMSRSYRSDAGEWETEDDATGAERVMPTALSEATAKPYFEVLFVTPTPPSRWPTHVQQIRKLRRTQDEFVYEPVFVGTFEDAALGVILNTNLEAVVIYDGFPYASSHDVPLLRSVLSSRLAISADDRAPKDYGLKLAEIVKRFRPELDVYLLADKKPDAIISDPAAAGLRRVFYEVEEPLEIHLSILAGVAERYETPFFNNLKKYAQKPVGTFHALPIARGKSIFKSNWIRDMGEFYGANLFLAESSATTGGLDSLLEPTGNIKKAQDAAARAFGADRVFFVTNGTSTSNKMVHQALLTPGDIVIADRNCHKSHHYGMVLAGAQPYYVEAFPMVAYSMYGAVPVRAVKKALLDLKAAGRLDKVKMVTLTNCTFDGHVYDMRRVMEECLAIKPDLIFLWDEAWFGFARFSPLYRPRTAMGARAALKEAFADPAYLEQYLAQEKRLGADLDPKDKRLLDTRLVPDPRKAKLRVYQTNSTHKSMSALRQGSMVLVGDEDYRLHEQAFKEAVFTHASTSPNQQLIASLDIARRQMELEGYELVMQAIHARHRNPPRGEHASPGVQVLPGLDRGRHGTGRVPPVRTQELHRGRHHLGGGRTRLPRGRVHPGSDPAHAGVRDRGLRRHAVQEPARRRVRDPAEQDLAQLDPAADQHQQHAERRGEPAQGPGRDLQGDRGAAHERRRGGAEGVRGAGEVADGGRPRPAELQLFPRPVPRRPEGQHAGRRHAHRVLQGL